MSDTDIKWTHLLEVLDRYGQYVVNGLQTKMLQNKSNASGTLTNSFKYTYGVEDGKYWVDVEMEDYWYYVDKGRNAGKMPPIVKIEEWIRIKPVHPRPYTYTPSVKSLAFLIQRAIKDKKGYAPPRKVLEEWITKKGIKPQPRQIVPSVKSLAFLIARKIGREGTKGTKFYTEVTEDARKYFERTIDNAIQEDLTDWLENVVNEVLENINI